MARIAQTWDAVVLTDAQQRGAVPLSATVPAASARPADFRPPDDKQWVLSSELRDFFEKRPPEEVVHQLWVYNQRLGMERPDILKKLDHTTKSTNIFMRTNPQVYGDDVKTEFRAAVQIKAGEDSPEGISVGDCHLGNFGTTPKSRFLRNSAEIVFTVVDRSKVSKAPIEWDVHRLASTTLTAAWEANHVSNEEYLGLLTTVYKEYFRELATFAFDPKYDGDDKPHGWLSESVSPPIAKMIADSSKIPPTSKVKKFTGDDHGNTLLPEYRIHNDDEFDAVKKGFAAYRKQVEKDPNVRVKPTREGKSDERLCYGRAVEVGGSGSGLVHYYVLADIEEKGADGKWKTRRDVIHIKRLVPAPFGETSIDPQQRIEDRQIINGIENPLEGAIQLPVFDAEGRKKDPVDYLVHPYDASENTLELNGTLEETEDKVKDAARVLARLHAQSADRDKVRTWLKGVTDDPDARNLSFDAAALKGAMIAKTIAEAEDAYREALAKDPHHDPGPQPTAAVLDPARVERRDQPHPPAGEMGWDTHEKKRKKKG
jgi:hypothetical protein